MSKWQKLFWLTLYTKCRLDVINE